MKCIECEQDVSVLALDSRCAHCTTLDPSEVKYTDASKVKRKFRSTPYEAHGDQYSEGSNL